MSVAIQRSPEETATASRFGLPPVMRVLYITNRNRTGGWLAEAFASDSACQMQLQEAVGCSDGLARLRDEAFDAVLVSHDPGDLDALDLIEGYRAGGSHEPIIILGNQSEQEMAAFCYEAGADAYVCVNTTTTRNLIWILARAVQRHQLILENQQLNQNERQRLQREHDEAERLLRQQRALVVEMETLQSRNGSAADLDVERKAAEETTLAELPATLNLPQVLIDHYRELLRTYVIMGSGNLARELSQLAKLMATAGVTSRQAMQLHVSVLEELLHGLGARSTRHVMTRADLLVMEIMIHLAERYRQRYLDRVDPPVQKMLPGLDWTDEQAVAF